MNLQGGIEIDDEELTHLRFADDIVLVTSNIGDLQGMLQELEAKSKEIGLKINKSKTKVMKDPLGQRGRSKNRRGADRRSNKLCIPRTGNKR